MFRIINIATLIRIVVGLTVACTIPLYAFLQWYIPETSLLRIFTIGTAVGGILIFLVSTSGAARGIWSVVRFFDKNAFPDINGSWEGEVSFEGSSLVARAVIRQTLTVTQIDLHTPTSKSITMESTPVSEGGQPRLYYVHRVTPKNPDWASYTGSTLFDVRRVQSNGVDVLELSGKYYTDRKTTGRIRLQQIGHESGADVSFY